MHRDLIIILLVLGAASHCLAYWVGGFKGNYSTDISGIIPEFSFDWISLAGAPAGSDRPYSIAFDSKGDLVSSAYDFAWP